MLLYLIVDHIQDSLTGNLAEATSCGFTSTGATIYGKLHVTFTVADESQTVTFTYHARSKKWLPCLRSQGVSTTTTTTTTSAASSKTTTMSKIPSMIWSNLDFYGQERIQISVTRSFFGISSSSSSSSQQSSTSSTSTSCMKDQSSPTSTPSNGKQSSIERERGVSHMRDIRLNDLFVVQQHGEFDETASTSGSSDHSNGGHSSSDDEKEKEKEQVKANEKEKESTFCFEYSIPWNQHQHPFLFPQSPSSGSSSSSKPSPMSLTLASSAKGEVDGKGTYASVSDDKKQHQQQPVDCATATSAASDDEDGSSNPNHRYLNDFKIHLRFRFIFEDRCLPPLSLLNKLNTTSTTSANGNRNSHRFGSNSNRFSSRSALGNGGDRLTTANLNNYRGVGGGSNASGGGSLSGSRDSYNYGAGGNNSNRNSGRLDGTNSEDDLLRVLQAISQRAANGEDGSSSQNGSILNSSDIAAEMNGGADAESSHMLVASSLSRRRREKLTELHKVILFSHDLTLFITLLRDLAYAGKLKDSLQYAPLSMSLSQYKKKKETADSSSSSLYSLEEFKVFIPATALHVCLLYGQYEMLRELLTRAGQWAFTELPSSSSSSSSSSSPSTTPLHAAILGGNVDCLRLLIKFIKKVSSLDESFQRKYGLKVMLEVRDSQDHTPLSLACSLSEDRSVMIDLLLKHEADCSVVVCYNRETCLTLACRHGFLTVIELILSVLNPVEAAPVVASSSSSSLIQAGFGATATTATTPAAPLEVPYTVFNTTNSFTTTSLDRERDSIWARCHFYAFMSCGRFLRQQTQRHHQYQRRRGSQNRLPFLRKSNIPIAAYKCNPVFIHPITGEQALHIATRYGHVEIVKLLIHHIGLSWTTLTYKGENLFHIAAMTKNHAMLQELIELESKRYEVTLQQAKDRLLQDMKPIDRIMMKPNVFGQTPLYFAKQQHDEEGIRMIVENMKKIYDIESPSKRQITEGDEGMKQSDVQFKDNNNLLEDGVQRTAMEENDSPEIPPVAFIDDEGYDFALTALYKKQLSSQ